MLEVCTVLMPPDTGFLVIDLRRFEGKYRFHFQEHGIPSRKWIS
jgi:hypothetical protein